MTSSDPRRPIVPDTRRRDVLIAITAAIGVLALVFAGIVILGREQGKPSANQLSGVIVAKHARGEREKEIQVGRKGLSSQETDSGYSFEIRVESEGRTYEVPVAQQLYNARKVGDRQSFIRPPSEQR
jgi:hypothetical protein